MNQPKESFPVPTSWADVQHVKCFLFQEFWEIDKISHFSILKSKGVYQNLFLVSKQAPLLIKYPTLKVREHLTSLPPPSPPLPPLKNFDSLLGRIA